MPVTSWVFPLLYIANVIDDMGYYVTFFVLGSCAGHGQTVPCCLGGKDPPWDHASL